MWKAGINWHGHDFDIDWWQTPSYEYRKNSTFAGQWSVFTRPGRKGGGIVKPMYNAFRALTIFGYDGGGQKNLVKTSFPEDDTVVAIAATRDDNKQVSLLISNFAPTGQNRLRQNLLAHLIQRMDFEREKIIIAECVKDRPRKKNEGIRDVLECIKKLKAMSITAEKKELLDLLLNAFKCLKEPISQQTIDCMYQQSRNLRHPKTKVAAKIIMNHIQSPLNDKHVRVCFANLPFYGNARITIYKIDSRHSNACILNKKTQSVRSASTCGIGGMIDKEIADAMKKRREEKVRTARNYLQSLGYTNLEWLKEKSQFFTTGIPKGKRFEDFIDKIALRTNFTPSKIKKDLKAALKETREAGYHSYFEAINRINNWSDVCIEGSEESQVINVPVARKYDCELIMEPNAVWLVSVTIR